MVERTEVSSAPGGLRTFYGRPGAPMSTWVEVRRTGRYKLRIRCGMCGLYSLAIGFTGLFIYSFSWVVGIAAILMTLLVALWR